MTASRPETRPENVFRRPCGVGGPRVIAHRGDSAHAPENTLEAARLGRERGAGAWELDVRLTRDRVPIVIHDDSLRRTTDVARRFADDPRGAGGFLVADFDLEEIRALDAGGWFLEPGAFGSGRTAAGFETLDRLGPAERSRFASGEVRVPTLAEALDLTARLGWAVIVELKATSADDSGLVEAVVGLIEAAGLADRTLISSFDHADVARVVGLGTAIAAGVLVASPLFRPGEYVRDRVGADAYHPSAAALGVGSGAYRREPSARSLRSEDLEDLRRAGVPVYVYTVNDAAVAGHLFEAGVAGVFADDPGRLVKHLDGGGGTR